MAWYSRILKAFRPRSQNLGGTTSFPWTWYGGTRYDYQTEAGDTWSNSVAAICIQKKAAMMSDLTLVVQQWNERKGAWENYSDTRTKQLLKAFRNPNDYYGLSEILYATVLNDDCRGHSVMVKRRNVAGSVVGFWVLPYTKVVLESDRDNEDGQKLISYVRYYTPGGSEQNIPMEDVVLVRQGLDPNDQRSGLSPLAAQLREVCVDNNASNAMASLLQNGPSGFLLSPKEAVNRTVDQIKATAEAMNNMARDRKGKVLPLAFPVDVVPTGYKPSEMDMGNLRQVPTDRICSALGGDPMAFGLPSSSKTYDNLEKALDALGNLTVIPAVNRYAAQWGKAVLADFKLDPEQFRLSWSANGVYWLADETRDLHDDTRESWKLGIIDRFEAKIGIGVEPLPDDKGVTIFDLQARARGVSPLPESSTNKTLHPLTIAMGAANMARLKGRRPSKIVAKRVTSAAAQAQHDKYVKRMESDFASAFSKYKAGTFNADELQEALNQSIYDIHRAQYKLGYQTAGGTPTDELLDAYAQIAVDGQQQFLLNFVGDVQDGRYNNEAGDLDLDGALKVRSDLYGTNSSGAASFGFVEGSPAEAEFDWDLTAGENCEDCVYLSELGPYVKETVFATPRSGDTVCLGNCRCRLVRSDGVEGFGPV